MDQQVSTGSVFKKNIYLLKPGNVTRRDNEVFLPHLTTDMDRLRRTEQFKTGVEFDKSMSEDAIRRKLEGTFPELINKRYSCAARAAQSGTILEFYGARRVWDGATIKKKLRGGSALYIVVEDETSQVPGPATVTSGGLTDAADNVNHHPVDTATLSDAVTPDLKHVYPGSFDMCAFQTSQVPGPATVTSGGLTGAAASGSHYCQTIPENITTLTDGVPPDLKDINVGLSELDWKDVMDVLKDDIKRSEQMNSRRSETTPPFAVIQEHYKPYQVSSAAAQGSERPETGYSSAGSSSQDQALGQENAVATVDNRSSLEVLAPVARTSEICQAGYSSEEASSSQDQELDKEAAVVIDPDSGSVDGWTPFSLKNLQVDSSVSRLLASFGDKKVDVIPYRGNSWLGESPPGEPGPVIVTVTAEETGAILGHTTFTYVPKNEKKNTNKQSVNNKRELEELNNLVHKMMRSLKKFKTDNCSEEDGTLDFQQEGLPNQAKQLHLEDILRSFVYTGAKTGARELIEVLFSISVGKIVFEAYKNEFPLPENIAEDNGHNDIAAYLRGITKRYSEEDSTSPGQSKVIDLLELANALEGINLVQSEPSSDKDEMWKDDISETGYSADGETSSSDLENENSDSDYEYKRIRIFTDDPSVSFVEEGEVAAERSVLVDEDDSSSSSLQFLQRTTLGDKIQETFNQEFIECTRKPGLLSGQETRNDSSFLGNVANCVSECNKPLEEEKRDETQHGNESNLEGESCCAGADRPSCDSLELPGNDSEDKMQRKSDPVSVNEEDEAGYGKEYFLSGGNADEPFSESGQLPIINVQDIIQGHCNQEPSSAGSPEDVVQQPLVESSEAANNLHSNEKPQHNKEVEVSGMDKEDATALSKRKKSRSISESTSDPGSSSENSTTEQQLVAETHDADCKTSEQQCKLLDEEKKASATNNPAMAASSGQQLEPDRVGARWNIASSASQKADCPDISISATPQEVPGQDTRPPLKVTLLGSEWNSSAGGLSTLNRELAIHLSKHPNVEVSLLVPEGACKDKEKREAQSCGITVVDAKECPGYDPLDWLSFPPEDLRMDVVVGHGVKLGRQGQVIRNSVRFNNNNCKWVQVVHTAPEDLSKYENYSDSISNIGERKHEVEVELCKRADLVVPVGPRLEKTYSSYLRRCKRDQDVFSVTPGLFEREFGDLEQAPNENADFKVLIFGRGDDEDFELKGYNIAVEAFTDQRLKKKPYHLIFVGAPNGKQKEVRQKLLQCGIAEEQLTVRKFIQSRDRMKDLFCEADLAIMPSKSEGFGLVALEALSAGLPILVGSTSGFAKALENVPIGHSCIVHSDDPSKWAEAIEAVRVRHEMRLEEIKALRASYEKKFSWKDQCEALVEKMLEMVYGSSKESGKVGKVESWSVERQLVAIMHKAVCKSPEQKPILLDAGKQASGANEEGASSLSKESFQIRGALCKQSISESSTSDEGSPIRLVFTTPDLSDEQQEMIDKMLTQQIQMYAKQHKLATPGGVGAFIEYIMKAYNLAVETVEVGSLIIEVRCPTLESLESLWNDYCSGHLNEVAERFLMTDEIKKKLNLETVRLKTTIEGENYLICKKALMKKTCTQAITVQLQITTPDLNDQQQEVFDDLIQNTLLFMDNHDPSKAEGQLGALIQYLVKSNKLLFKNLTNNGLQILLECPTLESLASLLKDHRSGHLSEVAERHIVTDEIKEILNLETVRLKTILKEETRFSEMLGAAGITRFPSKQNAPDQGASAKWTDTSPKRQKSFQEKKEDMNWMIRSEKAKASRGALHKASISGQCDTVKMLLESGEQVDQRDRFSLTPLHLACWYGQEYVVKLLLEHGANVNAVDRFKRTPLQKAERHNHQSIVQLLLKSNASPSYQQPLSLKSLARKAILKVDRRSGFNLLQAAVFEGEDNIVCSLLVLLEDFVKEMSLKTTGNHAKLFPGQSAVNILSSLEEKRPGHAKIDKWHLEDVEKYNTLTELHRCKSGDDAEKAVELVLNDGVDINIPALCNRTPLLWSSLSSSSEFIETLIDLGADVNTQRTDDKVTPLKLAACWNHYMAVCVLTEHGADANIQVVKGYTPLQFSAEKDQEHLVKLLLKNNSDVNSQNIYGDAPLHNSVRGGFFNISQLLIEAGSNVNLRNKKGRTPVYIAVKNKHEQLIELLLESNADLSMGYKEDPKDRIYLVRGKDKGKPAWHYVLVEKHLLGLFLKRTSGGHLDVADYGTVFESGWGKDPPKNTIDKILKKHEYDVMFKEIQGETLLHVASRNNNIEIVDLLVKYGAWDVNARDAEGFTPLHVAAIHGKMQVVKKLVDLKADVNQAIGIADFAHMNEEFEIEEYLKSKMDSQTTRRSEVKRDDAMENLFTGARVISREVVRVGQVLVESVTRALNS